MRSRIRAHASGRAARAYSSWLCGCLLLLTHPAGALTIRTVAITGETAPGTSGGTYTTFNLSTLNSSGEVSFTAFLEQTGGVDATNDLGVWSEGTGALDLVARRGSAAPGTTGEFESFISPPTINDAGDVTFRAFLQEEGGVTIANNEGLWSEIPGSLSLVAREASQAHDVPVGQNYASTFSDPTSGESQIAYNGSLLGGGTTTADNRALWAGDPTAPSLVARKGDVAAGVLDGATYQSFGAPVINASDTVAFRAPLDVGDDALFTGTAGGLQLLAREGGSAPGTAGQFAAFQSPDLNDANTTAFAATLSGVAAGTDSGIWVGGAGSLALVAQEGDVAPGAGAQFASFSTPLLNESDDVAFLAFLDDGGTGIFVGDGSGNVAKVAATSDAAPGTDLGTGLANFSVLLSPAFNDSGQVAFEAFLEGVLAGVTSVPAIENRRPRMESIFATLDSAGIDRADLYLAWDFTVASQRGLSERLLFMRDDAFATLGGAAPTFSVSGVTNNVDSEIYRQVTGTFSVPRYVNSPATNARMTYLNLQGQGAGLPDRYLPDQSAPFTCRIPRSATSNGLDPVTPARPSLYGHGLLGTGSGEVGAGNVDAMALEHRFMFCATDWIGMSTLDVPTIALILADMSNFPAIPDRLQQAVLNFLFLARLMIHPNGFVSNPAFQAGLPLKPLIDTSEVYYDGNSQGGIMGGITVAVSQDITKGVLGVPAMNYSTLLRRSVDYDMYKIALNAAYLGELDRTFHLLADPDPLGPRRDQRIRAPPDERSVPEHALAPRAAARGVRRPPGGQRGHRGGDAHDRRADLPAGTRARAPLRPVPLRRDRPDPKLPASGLGLDRLG